MISVCDFFFNIVITFEMMNFESRMLQLQKHEFIFVSAWHVTNYKESNTFC